MTTPGKRVPDLILDRYLAGDLAPRARAELERELGASPELRARLDELRAERDAFLAADPPERFAHRVVAKVAPERRARPRILLWLAPASAAAVGVLAVAFALRHGDDRPGVPAALHEERAPSAQAEPAPPGEPAVAPLAQPPAAQQRAPAAAPAPGPVLRGLTPPQAKARAEAHPRMPRAAGPVAEPERERTRAEPPAARHREPTPPNSHREPPPVASGAADSALPSTPPSGGAANPGPPFAAASRPESVVAPPSGRSRAALREAPATPPGPSIATHGALAAARAAPVLRDSLPRLAAARRGAGVATSPLTVTLDIDAGGRVTAARVLSPALSDQAARPILAVLRGLRFPAASPAGPTTVTMTVPAAR